MPTYADMTLDIASRMVGEDNDPELVGLLHSVGMRVNSVRVEQQRFREWCDRADKLYFAEQYTIGGADSWAEDPNLALPGRSHISLNSSSIYVDVPASLQATEPIENMLATDTTKEARAAAAAWERIFVAWKRHEDYELKFHKACTVKALYGRTAAKVYWDKDADGGPRPCVEVIEQPRNLFLGYKNDSYEEVEWAAYVQRMEPNAIIEEFGVDVLPKQMENGDVIPYVQVDTQLARSNRPWLNFGPARIEVWDYWYRKPVWNGDKFVRMETWNVVLAGTVAVRPPTHYPEYKGTIPYIPVFNTFVPGTPSGRPELYDMEQLIRETQERLTSGSQMIASGTAGDFWQLTGPEAPSRVPATLKPTRNAVVAPGPGNRIETITPFIAQFQLEQFLGRLDREKSVISGLNDLLLGLAPAQVLSSSKAINALIANYESRLSMRRKLLYNWRRKTWELVSSIWGEKDSTIKKVKKAGGGILDIVDPSLNPRDEMETATRVLNLVNGKLMSQRTGMDLIGIDDPETEQDMIREERTDATMFPADVQVMAQLMAALQSLGLQQPANATAQAQGQLANGQNDLRTALGGATPDATTGSQLPGDQGVTPPIPGAAPQAGGAPTPFAQGPDAQPGALGQTMIQGGKVRDRIMTQQNLGR